MGEQMFIKTLQAAFGGKTYCNGTRWIAPAGRSDVENKVNEMFSAEKRLGEAKEKYVETVKRNIFKKPKTSNKIKEAEEEYKIANMLYKDEFGIAYEKEPPDYWKNLPGIGG